MIKRSAFFKRITRSRWELGLVKGGLDGVFTNGELEVDWIINPYRDRWFADPFILDVTDEYVYVLAEEYAFKVGKGRIAKLVINRRTLRIDNYVILLELPTHLSFPNILRKENHVYVYPESSHSGKLDLYEYDSQMESLVFVRTICDDVIWDSSIVNVNGEPQLFTAKSNDYYLDIYDWDVSQNRFVYHNSIRSEKKDSRMAGQLFRYQGKTYMPSQYCELIYGGGVIIKEVVVDNGSYSFKEIKRLESTHPTRRAKMHTLNEYKDVVIIDVGGYDFPCIVRWMNLISKSLKKKR